MLSLFEYQIHQDII